MAKGGLEDASGMPERLPVGEDIGMAVMKFRDGGRGLFIPERMRRKLSRRGLRLARDIQGAAEQRERLLVRIDELVPQLREEGASWATVAFLTNMTAPGALKRWGGDDDESPGE